jgi:uncharacterized protein YegP (UPF0339 family)
MTNADHIRIYKDKNGQYRWHAVAGNGEIVAQGEAHTRLGDAVRAAQNVFPGVRIVEDA